MLLLPQLPGGGKGQIGKGKNRRTMEVERHKNAGNIEIRKD